MEVSGRRPRGSDDHSTGILCDPCRGENGDENAELYCTVCNEYLCGDCGKAHRRVKVTKEHRLLGRDSMPRQKLKSYGDNMCSKHSDKPVEYFCEVHDSCCCTVCATLDHKQCTIQYINDVATGFEKSNEYRSLINDISDLSKLLNKIKDVSTKNKKDIQNTQSDFVTEIRKFRAEINTILDSLEKTSLAEAQRIKDLDDEAADSSFTESDTMAKEMDELSSSMDKLGTYNQPRQLVIYSKKAATTVNAFGERAKKLSKQSNVKHYKFIPNEEIRHSLKSLTSLGQLKDLKVTKGDKETKQVDRSVKGADKSVPSPRQSSVTASRGGDIHIQHSTDTEDCWITGGAMLNDNKLALVDYNNSSVKLVDVNKYTVIACIKLTGQPWDIASVNKDQVVVTCTKDNKLVFLKVGKDLSIIKELDIGGDCRGIVYTNNTFIVTFDYESCVKVVNISGKVLKTFKKNMSGDKLFSYPQYISLSSDELTIYVSDCDNNSVTCLTLGGTVQHVYTADNLRDPQGLAVDRNNNVYVAGYRSNNIHQLSSEGQLRQVLLDSTHGLMSPQMVIYCKSGHKLYISNQHGSVMSVFQLQ